MAYLCADENNLAKRKEKPEEESKRSELLARQAERAVHPW